MARAVFPITIALSVTTAIVLTVTAANLTVPGLPVEADSRDEAAGRALAYAFYAAANKAIATGNLDHLATIVAPEVLGNPDDPAGSPLMLGTRLRALHASSPTLRLSPIALAADGDLVVVQVELAGSAPASLLGLDLRAQPAVWGPVDVFQVRDEQIVAHQGIASDAGWLAPIASMPLGAQAGTSLVLTMSRLTLAPGARYVANGVDVARLLMVEAGQLSVQLAASWEGTPARLTLLTGASLPLLISRSPTASTAYLASNEGQRPVTYLDLTLATPLLASMDPSVVQAASPAAPTDDGVTLDVVIDHHIVTAPATSGTLAVGRAILAPGDRLAWDDSPVTTLVVLETGSSPVAVGDHLLPAHPGATDAALARTGTVMREVGTGALVSLGTAGEVAAVGPAPANMLLVTLQLSGALGASDTRSTSCATPASTPPTSDEGYPPGPAAPPPTGPQFPVLVAQTGTC